MNDKTSDKMADSNSLIDQLAVPQKIQPIVWKNDDEKTEIQKNLDDLELGVGPSINGSALRQVLASFVAQLGTINTGMAFGFSAIALPQLESLNSTITISKVQSSWVASMSSIGTPIGCVLTGYMMDSLGRKKSLIITEIPALIGWILISFATNVEMLYIGRFLVGLGSGMVGAPARVYTSEVTQPHLRGMLTALSSVGVSTGVLLEYILGSIATWNIVAALSAIIPFAALFLMFIYPESPSYLISRSRPDDAKKALKQFRSSNYNLDKEMNGLIKFSQKNNIKHLSGPREIIKAILQPNALKPFCVLFFYFLIYQWSGTNALTFYAVQIFNKSGVTINSYLITVVLGVVRLLSTIMACVLCRKCGRRPLTMISSIGCGISMIGFSGYLWYYQYWKLNNIEPSFTWMPVLFIFSYTIACTIGFLVIPWVMIGEVYPVQVRGIMGGLTTFSAHSFVFSVVKSFPFLIDTITMHGTFLMFGCISLFGTIYFYTFLPETKNKTLQEIEDYFSGRNSSLKTGSLKFRKTIIHDDDKQNQEEEITKT